VDFRNDVIPSFIDIPSLARANFTTVKLLNADPSGQNLAGCTFDYFRSGSSALSDDIGPNYPREYIECYPGQFRINGGEIEADVSNAVNNLLRLNMTVVELKERWIEIAARLLAENITHEIGHALLGKEVHNSSHNSPKVTGDIMNDGRDRDFAARTGIEVIKLETFPVEPGSYRDGGVDAINGFTDANRQKLNKHFSIPPVFQ
jgi:hypothetical protein